MRIKKLYLLFIFIISLLISNLYYSNTKPSLIFENEKSSNIVLLIDDKNHYNVELHPLVTSIHDTSIIDNFHYQQFASFIYTTLFLTCLITKNKYLVIDKLQFASILFRYRHRVILS